MTYIQRIAEGGTTASLGDSYERLLATLGTADFGVTVHACLTARTAGVRRVYLFEAREREASELRYHHCEPDLESLLPLYVQRYLPVDPIHHAVRAAPNFGNMALQRVVPGDVGGAFRRRFFDDAGIVERVSFVHRGASGWRGMSLARHRSAGLFSDIELTELTELAALVLPMLSVGRRKERLDAVEMEARFARRFPALTHRECQVCARAALGMSVEATALDLAIGMTSVQTYRRRAYRRLHVTSPYELCSLVGN